MCVKKEQINLTRAIMEYFIKEYYLNLSLKDERKIKLERRKADNFKMEDVKQYGDKNVQGKFKI